MLKLLKEIKRLLKQGIASAEEKAQVVVMMKDLSDEEKDAVKDDASTVDGLPEKKEGDEDDENVKSILKSIDAKIATKTELIKQELDAKVSEFFKKNVKDGAKASNVVFDSEKYKAWVKSVKGGQKSAFTFEVKDFDFRRKTSEAGDMAEADTLDGEISLSELEPGITRAPVREPFLEQLVTVGSINSPIDVWLEMTGSTGVPLSVAELALLPKISYDFVERSARVKKIGAYLKYSREMAEDLANLVSEVRNYLVEDVRRAIDVQLLSGDGTGDKLAGILDNVIAYDAGDFAGTIDDANRFDVIETAVSQVTTALFRPNYVVVHPTDRAKMRLTKGSDGHYVLPPFIASDGSVLSGVRLVANTGITVGKFLVGDFTKMSVKYKRGLTVEMSNSDGDDFIRDRFTVKATVRLVARVKENDYEAFVYGDFDTAISALETVS